LFKKREEYNWILNRPKDSEKFPNDKVEVFVWWCEKAMFSTTPLRSYLKRLKQKDGVNRNKKRKECFEISKSIKTESILKKLIRSAGTHYWDDSFIGKELSEYLEAGVLRLKKVSESKVTKESSIEVIGQQSEPQQSEPQPSTSQQSEPQPSTSQVKVEDDEKQEDNKLKLSESQINGLILKLLSHVSVSVTSMTKDIAVVSNKLDRVTESMTKDIAVLSSKMDKVTETFRLCPNLGFDDDFCMT
jgi:hypothetical protein